MNKILKTNQPLCSKLKDKIFPKEFIHVNDSFNSCALAQHCVTTGHKTSNFSATVLDLEHNWFNINYDTCWKVLYEQEK